MNPSDSEITVDRGHEKTLRHLLLNLKKRASGVVPGGSELDVMERGAAMVLARDVARAWLQQKIAAAQRAANERTKMTASGQVTSAGSLLTEDQRCEAEAAQWFAKLHGFPSVLVALSAYAAQCAGVRAAPSIAQCVDQMAAEKRAHCRSRCNTRFFKASFAPFVAEFGDRQPSAVSVQEITESLRRWENPRVIQWRARKLSEFFAWAVRRKYAFENPIPLELRRPKLPSVAKVVFTPRQARVILSHTRFSDQIGYWVMSFFAGLRAEEIIRLSEHPSPWRLVDWRAGVIKLPGEMTGRIPRTLTISPLLRRWLKWLRARHAPFFPANAWEKISPVWKRAIVWNPDNRTKRLRVQKLPSRQESFAIARNTHLAYRLRLPRASLEEIAWDTGDTVKMVRQHYNPKITPRRARAFFALTPESMGKGIPPMRGSIRRLLAFSRRYSA